MSVWDHASHQATAEFMSAVTDPTDFPVYVFCADGRNRTGEMTAIYRIALSGWGVEEALREMDRAGFNPWYFSLRSYVWAYARKYRPEALPWNYQQEVSKSAFAVVQVSQHGGIQNR
jgi:hypothetical protein